ncbi:MAG: acyl-CoA dehydrogenase family protein [Acidobacteria bacterium]|nr:acyl-CoA dehydrogenase family protein [Acidobacteriota bacterium]
MRFDLSETQQLLKNTARKFLQAECPMAEVRRLMETETAHDPVLWSKIAAQGWTGIVFPEEYDGLGLGMVELAATMEEMGRALMPGPYLATVPMAGVLLDAAASAAQKRKYLAPICRGEARAAVFEGGLFAQDLGVADYLIQADRRNGALELVLWPASAVAAKPMPALDLTRRLYEVAITNPAAGELLARGSEAQAALDHMYDVATTALVAEMLGGMQRVLEITVEYAKTRKQFGKPIGQFQAVQHLCADMVLLVETTRSAAYYAAYALQEKLPEAREAVSIAKSYASEAYREVGNRGIQIHGGMGFTWENDLHLYYRRAKASEILFGDATEHRERIARLVLGG